MFRFARFAASCALTALCAFTGAAHATTVVIDASTSGCVNVGLCDGSPHWPAGTHIGDLLAPTQLTLAAGTYTITNGSLDAGADPKFSAWRFNGGDNWVWAFMMIDDATKTLLVQGCCGDLVYNTQAGAAGQSFAQSYSASFTLTQSTTLDFITEDYYPYDNVGGMTLDIERAGPSAVPEPSGVMLTVVGLAVVGGLVRRRRAHASRA